MVKCPGQDQRFWKAEDITEVECPHCGHKTEFFKDEPQLKCRSCKRMLINPNIDLGCAEWCQYAEQCIGATVGKQVSFIRDSLIEEMNQVFGPDRKRIEHALSVLEYAEHILDAEGGDPLIVKAAAILHDIGILEAERKHNSSAGKYQEIEGPPIARKILEKYELSEETVEHICRIIGSHHSGADIDTKEFAIVWDADWLVNIGAEFAGAGNEKLLKLIDKTFRTCKGRQMALESYIKT